MQLRVDVVLAVDGLHRRGVEVGGRQGLQATGLHAVSIVYARYLKVVMIVYYMCSSTYVDAALY